MTREHNMIRFANSTPQAIWFSQHASGQAFTYNALEKKGKRPIAYSGNGTHANYAVKGFVLPLLSIYSTPSPPDPFPSHSINPSQTNPSAKQPTRPHNPRPKPPHWLPPRLHRPRYPLGSDAKRLRLCIRPPHGRFYPFYPGRARCLVGV